jgi:folate-binding protein YgfZ
MVPCRGASLAPHRICRERLIDIGEPEMGPIQAPIGERDALRQGRAFADLSDWRKVRVTGGEARGWLGDLVTCDVATLTTGRSRRSLLLTPTGRIRADFSVACDDDGFLLLQPPDEPDHVGLLLALYILSSDVVIEDVTNTLSLFAVLGRAAAEVGHPGYAPSVVGDGIDLVTSIGRPTWRIEDALVKRDLVEVGADALEAARIVAGLPRMGVDYEAGALPAEVGLEWTIDTAKGCFLGQESVARVRNLGNPSRVLRHLTTDGVASPGSPVFEGNAAVGTVTSAAFEDGRVSLLAVLERGAEEAGLRTADGAHIVPVRRAG